MYLPTFKCMHVKFDIGKLFDSSEWRDTLIVMFTVLNVLGGMFALIFV